MTMLRFLRPIVFFGLLLFGAPGALAQNADERVVARELTKALTRATGETGDVRLSGAVPALETAAAAIAVSDIDFDPRSRRFTAVVTAGEERMQVAGRFVAMQRIPVPRHRIGAGQEIGPADVEWTEVETARMAGDIIDHADDVVGMAAKRDLMGGQPIRARDLTRPMMVTKGAMITMVFQSPYMSLSAVGRAVEGGSRGEVIQVMNLQSKKVVFATVTGPNQAVVNPGGVPLATN